MATKNNSKYLDIAIQSILNQTFSDWEFIIVNDGSSDDSHALITEYAATHPKITVIHNSESIGVSRARNLALQASSGTWVVILDGDDSCMPTRLQTLYDATSTRPDLVICGTFSFLCDPHLLPIRLMEYPCSDSEIRNRIILSSAFCLPSCALRKDAVMQAGGYNPSLRTVEDYDLSLRLLTRGAGANVPMPLYLYRTHNNSLTSTMGSQMILLTIYIRLKAVVEYRYPGSYTMVALTILQLCSLGLPQALRRYIWNLMGLRLMRLVAVRGA